MHKHAPDEISRARSALHGMDAGCDGERWVRIGMAAKAAGLPFEEFDTWSATADNYSGQDDTRSRWRSFRNDGGITAATLFHLAREDGWRDGAPRAEVPPAPAMKRKPEPVRQPRYKAAEVWDDCTPATSAHGYITRKGGQADGLRVYPDSAAPLTIMGQDVRGWLVVPALDAHGDLTTLQFISPAHGAPKLNLPGHSVSGFFTVGELYPGQTAYIVEGIGQAWSAHAATGCAALVAFGAGNQPKVAASAQALDARPVLVADRGKESKCERAAIDLDCAWVAMPSELPDNGDVNDIQQAEGLGAVAAVLAAQRLTSAPQAGSRDELRRAQQKAENARLQLAENDVLPPSLSVEQMERDCVWIAEGSMVGLVSDPRQVLSFTDFAGLTASSVTFKASEGSKPRPVANAVLWKHSEQRQTVLSRTFHAGATPICRDPDGKVSLNSWRPIERWTAAANVTPFLEQVGYLFPEPAERDAFLNWLAHLEQRPSELTHYGWLHIAANTGTGRNWLASLLARVWRGYVAPNVDLPALLDSQFNGQLGGRVLAIVDEVQEAAGENPYRHTNKLKSLVNAEYRDLNPKFGRQYREHNACRWLVFSNHDNALPLNDTDRRWRVVRHTAEPRSPSTYAVLYARLADREFINAVGVYLRDRNISTFNPGERPPMSEAKRAAVAASRTMIQQYAQQLVSLWPADIVTNADAAEVLSVGSEKTFTPAMRRALDELGCSSIARTLKVRGQVHRCWILRNNAKWETAQPQDMAREAASARNGYIEQTGLQVLADASETLGEMERAF